jgi:hypothetical protein
LKRHCPLIGEADLQSLIDDDKDPQKISSFCNKTYTFSRQQLTDIFKAHKKVEIPFELTVDRGQWTVK